MESGMPSSYFGSSSFRPDVNPVRIHPANKIGSNPFVLISFRLSIALRQEIARRVETEVNSVGQFHFIANGNKIGRAHV